MAEAELLSFAFMQSHPVEAARVLESIAPGESAALFARTPARLGQEVLTAMLPGAAARSLAEIDNERAMQLLGGLRRQSAVAILRQIAEPRRAALIAGLPTAIALASRLLLGFPEDSVGACADPDLIALPGETRAEDALARIRNVDMLGDRVFVTDGQQLLLGMTSLATLLRAPAGATLDSMMHAPEGVLSASAPLAGALLHPGWHRASTLPVVDAGGRPVALLTRHALARGLGRLARAPRARREGTFVGMMARGYWGALSGGIAAAAMLLPPLRDTEGTSDEP